jgi:hypothetical protein
MKLRNVLLSTSLLLLFSGLNFAQAGFVDGIELTTINAPWTMRILGKDIDITQVEAKPDERSAYFMMFSASTKLNVSVFIEPVDKCKSSVECRDFVLGGGNPAWGKYQDLAKAKIKDFSYFEFYRPEVEGEPLKILDMYAEYVDQGYWIDLHISKTLYTKADHALFENLVDAISFVPKGGKADTPYDGEIAAGKKVAAQWLTLWNGQKCSESYKPLSPLSKQQVSETEWIGYCKKVNGTLGEFRSRKLIASAFTSSLPTKTDRPVGILAFQSDYANDKAMVELIGLLLEKDGSWIMTNYIPQ